MQKTLSSSAFSDSKPHYELLDGLRGVAALLVIWYHVFEAFATSPIDQNDSEGFCETPVDSSASDGCYGGYFRSLYILYTR